jgi:hypothetical protein
MFHPKLNTPHQVFHGLQTVCQISPESRNPTHKPKESQTAALILKEAGAR